MRVYSKADYIIIIKNMSLSKDRFFKALAKAIDKANDVQKQKLANAFPADFYNFATLNT